MKKVKNIFVSILVLLVAVLSFGTVLITRSHESVANAGSGVYVEDGGEFNATGGVIKDNAKGAITINGGTHTIENVVFDGNLETAINVRGGVLNLVNCRITNNLTSSNGGAINVASGATLNLKGTTTITGNSAINGGAIYAAAGSTVNISGKLNIQNNTATSYGGAIFAAGTVNIAADFTGSIKGNTANIGADGYMNAGTLDVNNNASGFYFVTMAGTATTTSPKIIPNVDGVQNESIFATNTLDYKYINSALTGVATEENSCGWFSDETFVNGYTNTGVTTKLTADKTLYTKMATLDKLAFTVANGEASVKAKDSSITGSVVIPRKYNGTLVTNVAASGFKSAKVTTVTLSNSINKLNANSYDGCSTLTTINLLNGITEIPTYAFVNCSALESVTIPNSVTTMKDYAFHGCYGLKKVNINSVEKWCNITFSDWHANPLPFAGNLYLNNSLVENLVIPETITTIKPQAFRQCSSIKTVTMANSVTKIENSAFFGCANLKNITLSNNITVIDNHALRNCKSLTEINIPSSVTTIGSQAFDGCSSLTKVNITDLTKWCNIDFGYYSSNPLYYAHSLYLNGTLVTELVIPNQITKIKKYAFYNGSFVSVTISNGVTNIEKNAFAGCSSLTTITIPNSVTIINTDAFSGCSKLVNITTPILGAKFSEIFGSQATTVTLTKGTSIPDNYFEDYENLTSIIIPNSVTSIGNEAFYRCTSLTSVTIPSSVTRIDDAFFGCSSLKRVDITDLTKWCNIDFGYYSSNPLKYANNLYVNGVKITDLVIPSGITKIKKYAFEGGSFVSVTIHNSVTSIGGSAFDECRWLKRVNITDLTAWCNIDFDYVYANPLYYAHHLHLNNTLVEDIAIPNDITQLKDSVFAGAYIYSVTIPDSVTSIGDSAFKNCLPLSDITIPNSVTSIGSSAFNNCQSLTNIIIPNSVTGIGGNAFYNCSSLTSVTIPDSVTSIGGWAFYGCNKLTRVDIADLAAWCNIDFGYYSSNPLCYAHSLYLNGTLVTDFVLPNKITEIKNYAFAGGSFTSVTIHNSVTSIGNYAFSSCSKLVNITTPILGTKFSDIFGTQATHVTLTKGTRIPDNYFISYGNLTSIIIPNSVTSISSTAFTGCSNLVNVTTPHINDSIKQMFGTNIEALTLTSGETITVSYVADLSKLKTLVLPTSVTKIVQYAFTNCPSLTNVTTPAYSNIILFADIFGNNVTDLTFIGSSVPDYLVKNYAALRNLTISESINAIGKESFSGSGVTNVTIKTTGNLAIGNSSFINCTSLKNVNFLTSSTVATLDEGAFNGCTALETINLPAVTSIGNFAFNNCSSLGALTLPATLKTIGNYAFKDTTALNTITIPASVETIGTAAFSKSGLNTVVFENDTTTIALGIDLFHTCANLSSVTLGNRVKSMPQSMFYACTSLTSFEIPSTVTNLGVKLFRKCSNLATVTFASGSAITIIPAQMFSECTKLTSVNLPSIITEFAEMTDKDVTAAKTFENCTSLINITIPSSVITIGGYTFYGCSRLASVTIPNSVKTIKDYAFQGCYGLTKVNINSIENWCDINFSDWHANPLPFAGKLYLNNSLVENLVIPATITTIKPQTFRQCSSIKTVTMANSVTKLENAAFFGCANLKSVTLSDGMKVIGASVFRNCKSLLEITIPTTVTTIEDNAFNGCSSLTSVTIPNSGTSIGKSAFYDCSALTKVNITDLKKWCNISFSGSSSNPLYYAHDLYLNGAKITDLVLPSGVTKIEQYAFCGGSFVSVAIPSGVTSIGSSVFESCASLTTVVIPNSVSDIGNDIFDNCVNLVNVTTPMLGGRFNYVFGTQVTNITLTSGETITVSYVADLSKLKTLVLPTSVTKIEQYAFTNCPSLTNVTTPAYSNIILFSDIFGNNVTDLTFIGSSVPDYLVKNYAALRNLTISESINAIGKESFSGSGVTNVTIKTTGNLAIGNSSFINCTSLKNVNFLTSSTVATLDEGAFNGCTALETINLPAVTSIGNFAFNNCSSLGALTLPATLKTIGNYAFKDTTALNTITIPASVETIGTAAFSKSGLNTVVFENDTTTIALGIDLFHTCANLSSVTLGNRVKSMPQSMFYACTSLTSFEIPSTVTELGVKLFRKCSNLATVTFASGSTIRIIPAQMFSECSSLNNVSFPSTVTEFAEMTDKNVTAAKTFENCTSLTSVILPKPLYTIGGQVFIGCTALKKITLPINLCNIGSKVFSGCTNLSNVNMENTGSWLLTGTDADGVGVSTTISVGNNASANATYFKTTYVEYVWKKVIENINKFDYELNSDGTYTVIDNGCSGEVVIPSTYNGRNVTKILAEGFKDNKRITKITIPSTINYIGENAFSGCWNMKDVTFDGGGKEWVLTNPENNNVVYMTVSTDGKDSWYSNDDTSANVPISLYYRLTGDPYMGYIWRR